MKIGFITTLSTNIGDDFIRKGIQFLLDKILPNPEYVEINKHKPYSVYPRFHPLYLGNFIPDERGGHRTKRILNGIFGSLGQSKFHECDVILQSGAPVVWPNCHRSEWTKPIWYDIVGKIHTEKKVLNLAAGSCYPWESQPNTIPNTQDRKFISDILSFCQLTTVRDKLAESLFNDLYNEKLIRKPCTAFFSSDVISGIKDSDYVLINYMKGGGHFDWKQKIDELEWENTIKSVVKDLRKRHKVAFLAHDIKEFHASKELNPNIPVFFPKNLKEYFELVTNSKGAINNRMHASVGMASCGVPSLAVCTDSRLLMVENLGLPIKYVKDANSTYIIETIEQLIKNKAKHKEQLLTLKKKSALEYLEILKSVLKN